MPLKRQASSTRSSSQESIEIIHHKRLRSSSPASWDEAKTIQIYIVPAKIEQDTLLELYDLIEAKNTKQNSQYQGNPFQIELSNNFADADVIVTNVRMKKRLERHIQWDIAKNKAIVSLEWLYDSVKEGHPVECGKYAALRELQEETAKHCPDDNSKASNETNNTLAGSSTSVQSHLLIPSHIPIVKPTHPRVLKNWASRRACTRASPLICVNQELAIELDVLRRARELEGMSINALSYERSVAVIKCESIRWISTPIYFQLP